MIYILHGDDNVSSRTKLISLIGSDSAVTKIDGKKQSHSEILDAMQADNLFSQKRTIVIEFFTKIKPLEPIISNLSQFNKDKDTVVILWDNASIDKRITDKIKGANIHQFSYPKFFYLFLDGLSPNNTGKSIEILGKLLNSYDPEQILYAMVKRVRQLILLKTGAYKNSSEFNKMAPWQAEKLKKQADSWTADQLKNFFIKLAETDELIKTGGLTVPLAKHLDFVLLTS